MVGMVKRMVKIRQNHKIAYGRWDSHGDIHRDNDREERDNYRNYIYIYTVADREIEYEKFLVHR